MKKFILFVLLIASPLCADPILFYSDLTSGPKTGGENNKGVYVCVYGRNFGSSQGASTVSVGGGLVDNYPTWTNTKVCFQLGANAATGNIVMTVGDDTSNALAFTVRSGNIYFCTPTGTGDGSFASPFAPDDFIDKIDSGNGNEDGVTCYFRTGTYSGEYAHPGWRSTFALKNSHSGTSGNENAFVAYPGETATLYHVTEGTLSGYNFRRYDSGADHGSSYIVIANFNMYCDGACVYTGTYTRVIGNTCDGGSDGIAAGIIGMDGLIDGSWAVTDVKVYGNTISGGKTGSSLDHAVYPGYGADNIDIGWNIVDSADTLGTKISVNNNDAWDLGMVFENIHIHDNFINCSASSFDQRAVAVFEVGEGSTVYVYNNIFIGPSTLSYPTCYAMSGHTYWYNNSFYNGGSSYGGNTQAPFYFYAQLVYGHNYEPESITIKNNIVHTHPDSSVYIKTADISGTGSVPDLVLSNNVWNGLGAFDSNINCVSGCVDNNSVESDPVYTTVPVTAEADIILQSTSPAIGAGVDLSGTFTTDYFGVTRSVSWDIGAYESTVAGLLAGTANFTKNTNSLTTMVKSDTGSTINKQ